MKPNDTYYECIGMPKDEDFLCSDSLTFHITQFGADFDDHRHYFDHKVCIYKNCGNYKLSIKTDFQLIRTAVSTFEIHPSLGTICKLRSQKS
jgi:hypothetical protein